MFNRVDCNLELKAFEGGVLLDGLECVFEVGGLGIGGECLDDRAWGGFGEVGAHGGEVFGTTGEEGYSKVPVRRVGEDAGYARSLERCQCYGLTLSFEEDEWRTSKFGSFSG